MFADPVYIEGMRLRFLYKGHRVKVKFTWAKRSKIHKTAIGKNSGSVKHTAMKFACSMRFSVTTDRVVWSPSLLR